MAACGLAGVRFRNEPGAGGRHTFRVFRAFMAQVCHKGVAVTAPAHDNSPDGAARRRGPDRSAGAAARKPPGRLDRKRACARSRATDRARFRATGVSGFVVRRRRSADRVARYPRPRSSRRCRRLRLGRKRAAARESERAPSFKCPFTATLTKLAAQDVKSCTARDGVWFSTELEPMTLQTLQESDLFESVANLRLTALPGPACNLCDDRSSPQKVKRGRCPTI